MKQFNSRNFLRSLGLAFILSFSPLAYSQGKAPQSYSTQAKTIQFKMGGFLLNKVSVNKQAFDEMQVSKENAGEFKMTQDLGKPSLPYESITVVAPVDKIKVRVILGQKTQTLSQTKLAPVQAEPCRCPDDRKTAFVNSVSQFRTPESHYIVRTLGDWRGEPVTQVLVFPTSFDGRSGNLEIYGNAKFEISYQGASTDRLFEVEQGETSTVSDIDYLIVAPKGWESSVSAFAAHKEAMGLKTKVLTFEIAGATTASISALIKTEWDKSKFTYAMLIGDMTTLPAFRTSTSSSSSTPSDLPYFTYGGANDIIPDVLAGRVVANNASSVEKTLKRTIDYERALQPSQGWVQGLGVASNEGSNPSDKEYVVSIQEKFAGAFGTTFTHFYQDDSTSNPVQFNQAMGLGAMWAVYFGHGSGTSWASFNETYTTSHVKQLNNASVVKPVWIDVACQNGNLNVSNAGAVLMGATDAQGANIGTTAFYGGTVNISWHPPAILSRGIAYKMAEAGGSLSLGKAIQLGHVYLTENNSSPSTYTDNQRWYVLQGDPSLKLRLK